jgi:hypothetical protein
MYMHWSAHLAFTGQLQDAPLARTLAFDTAHEAGEWTNGSIHFKVCLHTRTMNFCCLVSRDAARHQLEKILTLPRDVAQHQATQCVHTPFKVHLHKHRFRVAPCRTTPCHSYWSYLWSHIVVWHGLIWKSFAVYVRLFKQYFELPEQWQCMNTYVEDPSSNPARMKGFMENIAKLLCMYNWLNMHCVFDKKRNEELGQK